MEQHPIPQNISSYEFRLVGDMTLKQFFQLSGGIIVGLIIFRTPLIGIVKYPLVFIAVMTGVAMAFIPLNGRPFGRWISAFLRAIYSPTEFEWAVPTTPVVAAVPTAPVVAPINIITPPPPPPAPVAPIQIITAPVAPPPPPPITPLPQITDSTVFTAPTQQNTNNKPQDPIAIYFPGPIAPKAAAPAENTTQISSPERPNIITGLITKSDNSPLDGAIIEIIDSKTGIPARALRSNRLGQFQIATPLPVGQYAIQTEKDGFSFDTVSIEVKDKIIEPIFIQGKIA